MQTCPTGTCPLRAADARRDFPESTPIAVPPPDPSDIDLPPVAAPAPALVPVAKSAASKFNFGPHAFFYGIAAGAVLAVLLLVLLWRLRRRAARAIHQ